MKEIGEMRGLFALVNTRPKSVLKGRWGRRGDTARENEIFKKDVQLSILAIVMSFLFIISFLPIVINGYSNKNASSILFLLCVYFYLFVRTSKLYFFLAFSSSFREAFVACIQKTRQKPNLSTNVEIEML